MRPYLAIARATAREALTYRLNFVLSLFGMLFQLFALLAIWRVVLRDAPLGGFTWPQMRQYQLVAFASGVLVSLYADFRMAYRIQSGFVALDLTKPVDYQLARLAETLGGVWVELLAVGTVCAGVVVLAGGGDSVPPLSRLGLFAVSMVITVLLKFIVVYSSGLLCFWTKNYVGVNWARLAVINLLSGALVPFAFFPGWLATLAQWLPFAGLVSTPGLIFVGQAQGTTALRLIGLQLGWLVLLWFGARLAWRAAIRQLTVHGG